MSASHKKGQAVILSEEEIPEEALKEAVKKIGYEVTSVSSAPYQKKGLFHR